MLSVHVKDVKAAQDYFQTPEHVFDNSLEAVLETSRGSRWFQAFTAAVGASAKAFQTLLKVQASDIITVNIVALNNMGPLKTQFLAKLAQEIPHFHGATLVFHPTVPRSTFSRQGDGKQDIQVV